jgi:hypothetical protein
MTASGVGAGDLPHGIIRIDNERRAAPGNKPWPSARIDPVDRQFLHVIGDAQRSMRVDAAQICPDECIGKKRRIRPVHAA